MDLNKEITVHLTGGGDEPLIITIKIPPERIPKGEGSITFSIDFEGAAEEENPQDPESDSFVDFEEDPPLTSIQGDPPSCTGEKLPPLEWN